MPGVYHKVFVLMVNHQVLIHRLNVPFICVQDDKYSHDVTQQLLVVVVPFWLKTNKDPTALLHVSIYSSTLRFVYLIFNIIFIILSVKSLACVLS